MHLVADGAHSVRFADGSTVTFQPGESVRTEISCKYDRPSVDELFSEAELVVDRWEEDDEELFSLVLGRAAS
jgi:uncharacterized SAM-dependent methyltransferase